MVLSVHEVFQVVANLVANAVFATKGGGRIAVEIERPRGSGIRAVWRLPDDSG
jgi:signal transduction histidine kinase